MQRNENPRFPILIVVFDDFKSRDDTDSSRSTELTAAGAYTRGPSWPDETQGAGHLLTEESQRDSTPIGRVSWTR